MLWRNGSFSNYLFIYLLLDFTEKTHCTFGPVPKRVTWYFPGNKMGKGNYDQMGQHVCHLEEG